jgi:lipopolysaccharide/colanic/teichoic acid biosynthesis glycosyltransferase
VILPDKIKIAKTYVENVSFKMDLAVIRKTFKSLIKTQKTDEN